MFEGFKPTQIQTSDSSNIWRMRALPCGHYPAEQVPDEVYDELRNFFKA